MCDFSKMRESFHGARIPKRMLRPLCAYLCEKKPPGGFLRSVLENNLTEAVSRAYEENVTALPAYIFFLYNNAPSAAWGSLANVSAWLSKRETGETP